MAIVKTLAKGQIVIPAETEKTGIISNRVTRMQILDYGGVIYLIPPVEDPIRAACGLLPPKPSLSEKLLKERKRDFR